MSYLPLTALVGNLFKNESEAAFSNYRLWESLGFIIAFAYSTFLCTSIKLYILTAVLLTGMIGYYTVEIVHRKSKGGEITGDSDKDGPPSEGIQMKGVKYHENEAYTP